jgi:hypothetical protein
MSELEVDIRHIKLVTGEEVISLVLEVTEGGVMVLSSPLQLHIIKKEDIYGYTFSPFMPLGVDGEVLVLVSNIVAFTYVTDDIRDEYINASETHNEETSIDELLVNEMPFTSTLH